MKSRTAERILIAAMLALAVFVAFGLPPLLNYAGRMGWL